jgi:hypothetical protein
MAFPAPPVSSRRKTGPTESQIETFGRVGLYALKIQPKGIMRFFGRQKALFM